MNKKFYLGNDKMIGGVCSGIAEYFDIDTTLVRIIVAVLTFGYGVSILPYLLVWALAPSK